MDILHTAASPFPVVLQPWRIKEHVETLPQLIQRINKERGHFRNITEASLKEELQAAADARGDILVEEEKEEVRVQDVESRRKELYEAKAKMLKYIGQAQNDTLTALDFISLLVSKDAPRQGEMTMSPALKQMVPGGTLGFDKIEAPQLSKVNEETDKLVTMGWSVRNLDLAADKLLAAASTFEEEMEKEARYWQEVLSVSERSWSLLRSQRDRHTVGVRFGFSEASPIFHARGLAALQRSEDGSIILDQGLAKRPKVVRVQIQQGDHVLGTSHIPTVAGAGQAPLETIIRQARDSLFEEELFVELTKEARTLLPYNVNIQNNVVEIPIEIFETLESINQQENITMHIELVSLHNEVSFQESFQNSNSSADSFAESAAVILRILLTNVYRRRFRIRRDPPPPLADAKETAPVYHIVRPLMAICQHNAVVRGLHTFLKDLVQMILSTRLKSSSTVVRTNPAFQDIISQSAANKHTAMEALVSAWMQPLTTITTLALPSTRKVTVQTTTHLSAPSYGTVHELMLSSTTTGTQAIASAHFSTVQELHNHIELLIRQDIAILIQQWFPGWIVRENGTDLFRVWQVEKKAKRLSMILHHGTLVAVGGWYGEALDQLGSWNAIHVESQKSLREVIQEASSPPPTLL